MCVWVYVVAAKAKAKKDPFHYLNFRSLRSVVDNQNSGTFFFFFSNSIAVIIAVSKRTGVRLFTVLDFFLRFKKSFHLLEVRVGWTLSWETEGEQGESPFLDAQLLLLPCWPTFPLHYTTRYNKTSETGFLKNKKLPSYVIRWWTRHTKSCASDRQQSITICVAICLAKRSAHTAITRVRWTVK